jgi:hypothetical protein
MSTRKKERQLYCKRALPTLIKFCAAVILVSQVPSYVVTAVGFIATQSCGGFHLFVLKYAVADRRASLYHMLFHFLILHS